MIDEKVTWESTGITYRTYLTPSGIRYHRGASSASPPPPPPAASASASRYLCKRKQVRTRYGRTQMAPVVSPRPPRPAANQLSINPPDRTRVQLELSTRRASPPDQRRSAQFQAARWVAILTVTSTPGQERALASECCIVGGCIPNSVLGFDFSTGFVVWVGR